MTSSHERDDVRRNIGLVFQDPTLDNYLTARQNLRLHAELYGLQSDLVEPRMRQVLPDGRPVGAQGFRGGHVLGRHAPPARDRPRHDALAARPVPRRADDRARPADPSLDLGVHPGAQGARGDHDLHDHALHGRGRVVRPDRDHGQRRDRRARLDRRRSRRRSARTGSRSTPTTTTPRSPRSRSSSESRRRSPRARSSSAFPRARSSSRDCSRSSGSRSSRSASRGPTLDDVFMSHTGTTIRDAEEDPAKHRNRVMVQMMGGARR